jgi:hypothetical protein
VQLIQGDGKKKWDFLWPGRVAKLCCIRVFKLNVKLIVIIRIYIHLYCGLMLFTNLS